MKIPEMKVVYSHRTNVLEQDPYSYTIQEVAEPNLFRSIYPYHEIPKLPFNHRTVPRDMPKEIFLTDTTFRDGQQSRAPYSVRQIVDLFDLLHRLSGPKGIVRQTEFFVYSDRDKEALYKCLERDYRFPEVTTWIRASMNDFKLVRDLGIKETGILVSCSDYHIFKKLSMTRREAMEHYMRVIHDALDVGLRPRCHFEDLTRADFYGFVVPFASALMELSRQSGVPIKIRACDTMGYGVPFVGAAPPRSVPGLIYGLRHYANVPSLLLEWHGHNDFYKGVANASTAWLYGASAVNCSLLGIGERTGNVPLEAMVIEYAQLRGSLDGMDPRVITEIAEYYEREIGYAAPPMTPFVGRNFNVTRAGIHADGLMKDEEIYNIFDTGKILNRPIVAAVSSTSGLAGIAYWINSYFRLPKEERVSKKDEIVVRLKELVDAEFAGGREVVISDDEMIAMVEQFAPGKYSRLKK
jgi:isopropylmalate/homocitrate/citramalate synthase